MTADAAQNGLGKDYSSVTEGVTLVLTIVGREYFLDWLSLCAPNSEAAGSKTNSERSS